MNAARVCVRPRIDDELDNLKHIYSGLDSVLVGLLGVVAAFYAYSLFPVQSRAASFHDHSGRLCGIVECGLLPTAR